MSLPALYADEEKYRKQHILSNLPFTNLGAGGILDEVVKGIEQGDRKYEQISVMNKVSQT